MLFFYMIGHRHLSANPRIAQCDRVIGCTGGKLLVNFVVRRGSDEATSFAARHE